MILKTSLRAKAVVPEESVKRKLRLHSLCFPQNTLTLTEFREEFSDLHSIFRLLRYCKGTVLTIGVQTFKIWRWKLLYVAEKTEWCEAEQILSMYHLYFFSLGYFLLGLFARFVAVVIQILIIFPASSS